MRVHYSVKANPAPEIVGCLHGLGAAFDVSSRSEVGLCLRLGVPPARLAYGSTVKKAADNRLVVAPRHPHVRVRFAPGA